ncbi:transglutaminase-like domain-containing protein [Streptomyces sp. N50]|uniref:transglutaminase-like domain-containing protein n=1 Tax=Streptomyces sp. N50 TaxID=3081765 RepID=UPI00296221BE|nr:transglutaminase-like domain-containing protein [Streptomyces sp. N50]WOX12370.1 transglutaminase-like domain-containing protein [Streptomyces sp. N50]
MNGFGFEFAASSPCPPSAERAAEVRQLFAEEARAERPDLATLCLLVGAAADGGLDDAGIDSVQVELDRLAGQLPYRPGGPAAWASALRQLLGERFEFRGSPGDYQRLESSLLHAVLRRRSGLPILLSVVWMEVARRAGAPVYGVGLPGHFVVGFGAGDERVLADPFDGGRVLAGGSPEASVFAPAAPLEVVTRVLNNIRAWAADRADRGDVALWAVELALLLPSHPAELRYERAQLLVRRGDFLTGAAELDAYAEVVAAVDEAAADLVRGKAQSARAMLN